MKAILQSWFTVALLLIVIHVGATEIQDASPGPSIVGIDHMPLAVKDLEQASDAYRRLGFSLKPGRFHEDGTRNNHVKFRDGSGIELLTPPSKSGDALTAHYLEHLKQGDGPAYISFHARDIDKLVAALETSGFRFKQGDLITLEDPLLNFIFFDQDNRSPTDKPEHFAHPNSAIAMSGVWLALDDESRKRLTQLLIALGAVESEKTVFVPDAVPASVFTVQNGQIVVLPKNHQLFDGRPVVGAAFHVRDIATAGRYLKSSGASSLISMKTSVGQHLLLVPPLAAHGLWLEFREER